MASLACGRIEEVDRKAKKLLSQLKTGEIKHEDLIVLKQDLNSKTFNEEILEECTDETKSAVNTEVLLSVVSNFYELIECLNLGLKVSTQTKDSEIEGLIKQVRELKIQVERLTKQLEELKKDRTQLMIGQLAVEVEKAIIDKVLTNVIGSPKHYVSTLKDMEKALKRKPYFADILTDDSNHEKATKKWKELQRELNWEEIHFRYIKSLKKSRVAVAHPKFEAAMIQNAIKENKVDQHTEEACNELMKLLEKLEKN